MAASSLHTPRVRRDQLTIEPLGDELLIYDEHRQRAHCLNRTAALVFQHCDGHQSVAELAVLLEVQGIAGGVEVVELTLAQLNKARLLVEEDAGVYDPPALASRRRALRQLALATGAALVLPLVETITAPAAAQAASCGLPNRPCCPGNRCMGALRCIAGRCR